MHVSKILEARNDKGAKLKLLQDVFAEIDDPRRVQDALAEILADKLSMIDVEHIVSQLTMKYDKEDLDVDKTLLMKKLQKLGYTVSEDASTVMSPAGASHAFDAVWSPGKGGMNAVIDVFFHKGAWSIYATAGNGKATSKRFMDVGELAKELDTLGAQLIDKTKYAYEKSKQPKKAF